MGVALFGSCAVWELQCVEVAVCGSSGVCGGSGVWKLQCVEFTVCGSRGVCELRRV